MLSTQGYAGACEHRRTPTFFLEEALTLARADETAVEQMDALLDAALDDREGPLVLVTTIRSDFVARMGELPLLERELGSQTARQCLRPMDDAGLRGDREAGGARLSHLENSHRGMRFSKWKRALDRIFR